MARLLYVGVAALAALVFACLAGADDDPPAEGGGTAPEALFEQLDANGDGQLAVDEVDEGHRRLFQRLLRLHDTDGDGKLSSTEFAAGLAVAPAEIPADEPPGSGSPGTGPPGTEANEQLARFLQADPMVLFQRLDANGDGKLLLDELPEANRPQFAQFFERADVDRDKSLTLEEFRKGHEVVKQYLGAGAPEPARQVGPGQRLMRALDLDGDGQLSADEIAKASQSLAKLDLDGDGTLSRRELVQPPQAPGKGPGSAPGKPPGFAAVNPQRLMERLKQLDTDGDGKLKEDELPPFLKGRFAQIDTNGDGFADMDELRKMAKLMQQRMKQANEQRNTPKPDQKRPE